MEIEKEITKEVFELNCPAAKTPERNTSVYNRMVPFFRKAYQMLIDRVFGDGFEDKAATDALKTYVITYVCCDAFCEAIPSLDIVLTGTGFGIVSTNDTAPASQQRVKALRDDMQWKAQMSLSTVISRLAMTDGWGETGTARNVISVLYYSPDFVVKYGGNDASIPDIDKWRAAVAYRYTPEMKLRMELSEEYYNKLLEKLRTNAMGEADRILFNRCMEFESSCINAFVRGTVCPDIRVYGIRDYMERYIDSFPDYKNSTLYSKLHGEHYENGPQDPTFFFTV